MKKQVTRKLTSPWRLREVAAAAMELASGGARVQVIEIGSPTAPSTEPSPQARVVVLEIG